MLIVSSAHCEKQIVVPNTSILFCSEKCKRKDQARPPPLPIPEGSSFAMPCYNSPYGFTPPHSQEFLDPPSSTRNYVQPFSPTRPARPDDCALAGPMASMTLNTNHTPAPTRPNSTSPTATTIPSSFSSTTTTTTTTTGTSPANTSNIYHPPRRPHHLRSATSGSIATTSSLQLHSNSPVPVPSQYQYGQQQRPLPPLHRPSHPFSSSSSPRSIDLVTPLMTPVSPRQDPITTGFPFQYQYPPGEPATGDGVRKSRSSSTGSCYTTAATAAAAATTATSTGPSSSSALKTLFNFDAIRGVPYMAEATSPDKYLTYSNGTPILARMSPTSVHMK